MKIIIEIKNTASLVRIAEFLILLQCNAITKYAKWHDVIESISREY